MTIPFKNYSLLFSLLGHGLLIFLISWQWRESFEKMGVNEKQQMEILSSYLYQPVKVKSQEKRVVTAKHSILLNNQIKLSAQKQSIDLSRVLHNKPEKIAQKAANVGDGEPIPALVAMLHTAIQKAQHYPPSALHMEREGKVRLIFTLFPNGTINHLKIRESSGTTDLDNAALLAVNEALPFKGVEKFLNAPQSYQVDVIFELT